MPVIFDLQDAQTYPLAPAIPITDGQTVTPGQILRLVSNRVRKAMTAQSDWFGMCESVSDGTGTGNSGGTVTAAVRVFNKVPSILVDYASAVASGDPLDIATAANALTTNTNSDFRVVDQTLDGAVYRTIVQPAAGRLLPLGTPGLALTADEVGAVASALGTPTASAPFATWDYIQANIETADLTADEIAAVTGHLGTASASEPFGTFVYTMGQIAGAKMYAFTASGLAAPGNSAVTSKITGISPAAGDKIIFAARMVTVDSTAFTLLQVGATDIDETLVSDSGIKLTQISASNWSAETIIGLAVKVA